MILVIDASRLLSSACRASCLPVFLAVARYASVRPADNLPSRQTKDSSGSND